MHLFGLPPRAVILGKALCGELSLLKNWMVCHAIEIARILNGHAYLASISAALGISMKNSTEMVENLCCGPDFAVLFVQVISRGGYQSRASLALCSSRHLGCWRLKQQSKFFERQRIVQHRESGRHAPEPIQLFLGCKRSAVGHVVLVVQLVPDQLGTELGHHARALQLLNQVLRSEWKPRLAVGQFLPTSAKCRLKALEIQLLCPFLASALAAGNKRS